MLTSLTQPSAPRMGRDRLVIEVAGPAGSGKTTLRRLLCREEDDLVEAAIPTSFQSLRQLPWVTPSLLATYLRPGTADRRFTWDEIRSMLYVQAWLRSLRSAGGDQLFDQGPVFRLAVLQEFGPKMTRQNSFDRWRRRVLTAWSRALDVVIWLDAPNAELMHRIRGRDKPHRCKSLGNAEAHAMLDRYRDAHEDVLAVIERQGHSRILRFDSEQQTPRDIARMVHDELEQIRRRDCHAARLHACQFSD